MPLSPGDAAPDFEVHRPDGSCVGLAAFDPHPLVLIFLRHLA